MPQEIDHLQRARDAYRQARDLYERIPAFPGVGATLRRTERALERIDERLAVLALGKELVFPGQIPWR
jgi:hypothetical protein